MVGLVLGFQIGIEERREMFLGAWFGVISWILLPVRQLLCALYPGERPEGPVWTDRDRKGDRDSCCVLCIPVKDPKVLCGRIVTARAIEAVAVCSVSR